jgi:hypothetical protein
VAGHPSQAQIDELAQLPRVAGLSINNRSLLGAHRARGLAHLRVERLWLWTSVTAPAMRHLLQMPALRELDVLRLTLPVRLEPFRPARGLEVVRINCRLPASAVLRIAACDSLRELGLQGAELTPAVVDALLALPGLEALDIEASGFDDAMAKKLAASASLVSLDVGATRLTRTGLAHLAGMASLRNLDLWATDIQADDLALLERLPKLEYLSVGGCDGDTRFDPQALTDRLLALPALERVWLDGVVLQPKQVSALEERLGSVRIT